MTVKSLQLVAVKQSLEKRRLFDWLALFSPNMDMFDLDCKQSVSIKEMPVQYVIRLLAQYCLYRS